VVRRGATEVWEYRNDKKSMPHPMHVHGFDQRVLERRDSPEQVRRLAVDEVGRIATDLGRKDTVTVWPGETVRVAIDFSHDHDGEQAYLLHCHVLEHEDQGMMLNLKVVPAEN
jgi:suppressor of ftsI/bilirubin oxidase